MAKERPPLEEMTLRQLRKIASDCNIYRYSRKRKQELLFEIQKALQISDNTQNKKTTIISDTQEEIPLEPEKFELKQEKTITEKVVSAIEGLVLPEGYGESRIVLMPRDSQWTYAYWDIPNEHKEELRKLGGQQLVLRLYDVTHIDFNYQVPHSVQEYFCDEVAREWYLPVPVSNRDYIVEIGYRTFDGRWLILARSASVQIPPAYPCEWVEDVFVTVNWEEDLRGKTVYKLVSPEERRAEYYGANATNTNPMQQDFDRLTAPNGFAAGGGATHSPRYFPDNVDLEGVISSYVLAPGMGQWAASGSAITTYALASLSGVGRLGFEASGIGMLGFSASVPTAKERGRKFWLVADAELIVYGATEPDATVTIGGRQIKLEPDGTFRFQMSFPDSLIDYPIKAVAVDGEQTRSIHMEFNRQTSDINTNTKEDAVLEWF